MIYLILIPLAWFALRFAINLGHFLFCLTLASDEYKDSLRARNARSIEDLF